jgi:hypothetical protein
VTTPTVTLVIDGEHYPLDMDRFMLSEAIALEDDWGMKVADFTKLVTGGDPPLRVLGAMVWLAKTRALAAQHGITFPEARKLLPPETFDVDMVGLAVVGGEELPENPTGSGTRTRATRTTPATSAKRRKTGS